MRGRLRDYERSLDRTRRKRLGQYFTGSRASSLLAALGVHGCERTIVDPMAGHGDLLDAVAMRAALDGQHVALTGVEIDPPTAELALERLRLSAAVGQHTAEMILSDAFTPELWTGERAVGSFDLVIANPPYVRYQARSDARKHVGAPSTRPDIRKALHALVRSIPVREEKRTWTALIDGYSGLADLSIPSWILCALLVRPGGTLALVVPRTWMNRDYATIVQYLQLRLFEPMVIVEEHGVGWFEDALVPATLVVSRRREATDTVVPLTAREETDATTVVAAIRPSAADSRSLVGRAFPDSDPDAAFAEWLCRTDSPHLPHVTARRVSWTAQQESVFRRCQHESWFRAAGEAACTHSRRSSVSVHVIPPALQDVFGPLRPASLTTLEQLGYQIGQGLRTGCNAFFYVDAIKSPDAEFQTVRTSATLGGGTLPVPREILQSVVRRQSDVPGFAVDAARLSGQVLVLHGWCLPEDAPVGALKRLPDVLSSHVRHAATTEIGPPERRVLIPELSAVRTNGRVQPTPRALFTNGGTSRYWYTLPSFAPRHRPVVSVPRVNSGTPFFFLNTCPPTLTDANFSTIFGHSDAIPPLALLALLNSTWVRACAECIGTPMGGGALKLEATQLRDLPLPALNGEAVSSLTAIGTMLARMTDARSDDLIPATDTIVLRALFPHCQDLEAASHRLLSVIVERREQRVRARKESLLWTCP